jgi:hypothetical protein
MYSSQKSSLSLTNSDIAFEANVPSSFNSVVANDNLPRGKKKEYRLAQV